MASRYSQHDDRCGPENRAEDFDYGAGKRSSDRKEIGDRPQRRSRIEDRLTYPPDRQPNVGFRELRTSQDAPPTTRNKNSGHDDRTEREGNGEGVDDDRYNGDTRYDGVRGEGRSRGGRGGRFAGRGAGFGERPRGRRDGHDDRDEQDYIANDNRWGNGGSGWRPGPAEGRLGKDRADETFHGRASGGSRGFYNEHDDREGGGGDGGGGGSGRGSGRGRGRGRYRGDHDDRDAGNGGYGGRGFGGGGRERYRSEHDDREGGDGGYGGRSFGGGGGRGRYRGDHDDRVGGGGFGVRGGRWEHDDRGGGGDDEEYGGGRSRGGRGGGRKQPQDDDRDGNYSQGGGRGWGRGGGRRPFVDGDSGNGPAQWRGRDRDRDRSRSPMGRWGHDKFQELLQADQVAEGGQQELQDGDGGQQHEEQQEQGGEQRRPQWQREGRVRRRWGPEIDGSVQGRNVDEKKGAAAAEEHEELGVGEGGKLDDELMAEAAEADAAGFDDLAE